METIRISFERFGDPEYSYRMYISSEQLLNLLASNELFTAELVNAATDEHVIFGEEIKNALSLK
jgi:hypothetical protein